MTMRRERGSQNPTELDFASRKAFSAVLRGVMSRMALEMTVPSGVSIGLKLISIGELSVVLSQPVQLRTFTHQSRARMGGVGLSMLWMPSSKSLWHQDFNGATDQLVAPVAEQTLRLCVY